MEIALREASTSYVSTRATRTAAGSSCSLDRDKEFADQSPHVWLTKGSTSAADQSPLGWLTIGPASVAGSPPSAIAYAAQM